MLPLCSAPLIALLVAGEDWRPFLFGTLFTCWDITILSCYLNASIYLVKGGRLGLPPSLFFPRVSGARWSSYLNPPGQCSSEYWSKLESCAAPPRGNSRFGFSCMEHSSECALRTRCVQLLSGFVGTFGWLCWTCFTIVEDVL